MFLKIHIISAYFNKYAKKVYTEKGLENLTDVFFHLPIFIFPMDMQYKGRILKDISKKLRYINGAIGIYADGEYYNKHICYVSLRNFKEIQIKPAKKRGGVFIEMCKDLISVELYRNRSVGEGVFGIFFSRYDEKKITKIKGMHNVFLGSWISFILDQIKIFKRKIKNKNRRKKVVEII